MTATVEEARQLGVEAMNKVEESAAKKDPTFAPRALKVLGEFASRCIQFSGEDAVDFIKAQGIEPHDDRAFGPVFMKAIKSNLLEAVGYAPRRKGHGTSGGRLYRFKQAVVQ